MLVKEQLKARVAWACFGFFAGSFCWATRRGIFQEQADLPLPDKGSERALVDANFFLRRRTNRSNGQPVTWILDGFVDVAPQLSSFFAFFAESRPLLDKQGHILFCIRVSISERPEA